MSSPPATSTQQPQTPTPSTPTTKSQTRSKKSNSHSSSTHNSPNPNNASPNPNSTTGGANPFHLLNSSTMGSPTTGISGGFGSGGASASGTLSPTTMNTKEKGQGRDKSQAVQGQGRRTHRDSNSNDHQQAQHFMDRDRDRENAPQIDAAALEREREREAKQGKNKSTSHVPCRFFRMGMCDKGEGCVFSHDLSEPGHTKQVCQYFLKGNCKFGHKCALAHVLPNEPVTMDRKHKKAAQLAANGVPQMEIESTVYGGAGSFPKMNENGLERVVSGSGSNGGGGGSAAVPIGKGMPGGGGGSSSAGMAGSPGGRAMSYSQSVKSPPAGKSGMGMLEASMAGRKKDGGDGGEEGKGVGKGRARRESHNGEKERLVPGAMPIKTGLKVGKSDSAEHNIGSISPANRHQAALLANLGRPQSLGKSGSPTTAVSGFGSTTGGVPSSPSGRVGFPSQPVPRLPGNESENFKSRPVPLSVPGPLPGSTRTTSFGQDPIGTPPREITLGLGSFTQTRSGMTGSPFSAPGSKSTFPLSVTSGLTIRAGDAVPARPGMMSAGSAEGGLNQADIRFSTSVMGGEFGQMGRDIWGQRTSLGVGSRTNSSHSAMARPVLDQSDRRGSDVFMLDDVEGDDAEGEEWIPDDLKELLTPKERARRLSRRESGSQPASVVRAGWLSSGMAGSADNGNTLAGLGSASSSWDSRPNMEALLNRQALSAGAVDGGFLRSLWDEAGEDARKRKQEPLPSAGGAGSGLSSMFGNAQNRDGSTTTSASGQRPNDGSLTAPPDSGFQLGPSNASVSFLPTFVHRHSGYLNEGSGSPRGNLHSPSRPSPLHNATQATGSSNVPVDDGLEAQGAAAHIGHPLGRIISPGTRALQSHAPGQSLPQGLAAGLSRLHLRPAPVSRTSTGSSIGANGAPGGSPFGPGFGGVGMSPNGSRDGFFGPPPGLGSGVGRYETLAQPGMPGGYGPQGGHGGQPQQQQQQMHAHHEGDDDGLFDMEG